MMTIIEFLHRKVDGLLYLSETEHPITSFEITATTAEELPALLATHIQTQEQFVKNILPEVFFARFEKYLAYGGPDELMNDNARKFISLRDFLQDNFLQTFIYKIEKPGDAVIPIFIISKMKDGSFAGLQTLAVET